MKTTVTWADSPVADCLVPLVNLVVPARSHLDGAQIQLNVFKANQKCFMITKELQPRTVAPHGMLLLPLPSGEGSKIQ